MSTVLDFYGPQDAAVYRCLAQNAQGIARYLTNRPDDPRQLTPAEVRAAHDAGLDIHFVYEMSPTYAAYFTFAQGAEDCRQAQNRLRELGAPDGSVVYFAVDAPPSTVPVAVLDAYFNGVESAKTPLIEPGIYGFEAHIAYARTRFPNIGRHLWQTYGEQSTDLDLWQHLQETRCGVEVDVNYATVSGWKGADMTRDEVIALLAEYGLDKYKVPALVKEFETHVHATPPNLSGGPIVPPFDGATYFGASADMRTIGWNDSTTGKTRYFKDGVEVQG